MTDGDQMRRAERQIIDAIEAQFDIHAMEPEDFAEMWVAISSALKGFAAQGTEAQQAETVKHGSVHDGPVAASDAPQGRSND